MAQPEQRSRGPALLTLQGPHVVGCQVADEGLLGAAGNVWPQDAGGGANCHVVPGMITQTLSKAQGSQSFWPWQSQAPELPSSAGQGLKQPGTL